MSIFTELVDGWRLSGIERGDTVLLHTSCKRTFQKYAKKGKRIEVDLLFRSFMEAVGDRGTILFPTFNFGFCAGEPYDIRHTPSKMGVLTEYARLHPGAVRNGHPAYSFATHGYNAGEFDMDNYRGLGKGSPFDKLRELDGRVASLDLDDQHSMTFYHHVDAMTKAPHRFFKMFTGSYTGWNGMTSNYTYGIYVRRRSMGIVTDLTPMEEQLWGAEVYVGFRPMVKTGLRVGDANTVYNFVKMYYEDGKAEGYTYYIDKDTIQDD